MKKKTSKRPGRATTSKTVIFVPDRKISETPRFAITRQ